MPITLEWHNSTQTIITMHFQEQWDLADFIHALESSAEMMQQVSHTVHIICDFSGSEATPRDLLGGFQFANRILPKNQGIVVYLNPNAVIKAFVLMAKRTGLPAAKFIYNAETCDEAFDLIRKKAHRVHTA